MSSIFTPRMAVEQIRKHGVNSTCTKILFHGFEISVAMDDSCGGMQDLGRTDIRVYIDDVDVTGEFFTEPDQQYIRGDSEELFRIMSSIEDKKGQVS